MPETIPVKARGKIKAYCFNTEEGTIALSHRDRDEIEIHRIESSGRHQIPLVPGLEALSLSADGRFLAAGGENTGVWVVNLDDGAMSEFDEPPSTGAQIRFSAVPKLSPNGSHLAVGYPSLTRIWRIDDRTHLDLVGDSKQYMNWPYWLTDDILARTYGAKTVPVTDLNGTQIVKLKTHKAAHRIVSGYGWVLLDGHSIWKSSDWTLASVLYGAPLFYAIRSTNLAYSATKNQVEEIDLNKLERRVISKEERLGRVDIEIWDDRLWSIERMIDQINLVEIPLT